MRAPDAEVLFALTALTHEGRQRCVTDGYRPQYSVRPDYMTSVEHRFIDASDVSTGQKEKAKVWFITPDVYPGTLWVGREIRVTEGNQEIGNATVLQVFNPLLLCSDNP
jgi:translation elongation factor EF-Tu-like GTPase